MSAIFVAGLILLVAWAFTGPLAMLIGGASLLYAGAIGAQISGPAARTRLEATREQAWRRATADDPLDRVAAAWVAEPIEPAQPLDVARLERDLAAVAALVSLPRRPQSRSEPEVRTIQGTHGESVQVRMPTPREWRWIHEYNDLLRGR